MDYKYTGDDFNIKKAPTKVKDSADELEKIKGQIEENLRHLRHAQKMMYARHKYGILVVFQAMDAAGKDSMIAHIFSGVNQLALRWLTLNNQLLRNYAMIIFGGLINNCHPEEKLASLTGHITKTS